MYVPYNRVIYILVGCHAPSNIKNYFLETFAKRNGYLALIYWIKYQTIYAV